MEERLHALLQALQPYHPERVILFGSAARGEADADSDLDVLVIKDTAEPFVQRLETMARLCPVGVHADILVYTPAELSQMVAEGNPFIIQALQEGKVVYEAGT
ncbi:MAG: nucleotidyltransferase domain-containing protein [Candidatus Binatia bacterium]|nr:nucleotidyltransferase domain-containing protein [Candidatus Binatia bacterium]